MGSSTTSRRRTPPGGGGGIIYKTPKLRREVDKLLRRGLTYPAAAKALRTKLGQGSPAAETIRLYSQLRRHMGLPALSAHEAWCAGGHRGRMPFFERHPHIAAVVLEYASAPEVSLMLALLRSRFGIKAPSREVLRGYLQRLRQTGRAR